MAGINGDKLAVILLAMGGPDKLSDIKSYIYNIFSDRAIIRLPGGKLMQKPLARIIAQARYRKVQERYRLIGGRSPLLKWTTSQSDHIQMLLRQEGLDADCYVGMRYFTPTIETAMDKAYSDGHRFFCILPMYPQYCKATTGSSFTAVRQCLARLADTTAVFIDDFHDDDAYTALLGDYINANVAEDETILICAHSIPQKFVDEGDPYVNQVRRTAALAAGGREYFLSFQSRVGPIKWVGPDSTEEALRLVKERGKQLFVVPVSFMCDHLETLFDVDIDLKSKVSDITGVGVRRMPMFNDDSRLGRVLADIVLRKVQVGVV